MHHSPPGRVVRQIWRVALAHTEEEVIRDGRCSTRLATVAAYACCSGGTAAGCRLQGTLPAVACIAPVALRSIAWWQRHKRGFRGPGAEHVGEGRTGEGAENLVSRV
eukprot:7076093-Prymnesium_polylepis.1